MNDLRRPSSEAGHARYWPALDGMRAVAVGLVVAYHLAPASIDRGGTIGVTMFFTLSGFLITSLLLTEADRTGGISVLRFYARRAWRLLPALLLLVAVVGVYAAVSGRDDDTISAAPAVLLYIANWVRVDEGFNSLGLFEHTWSLGVEEQFYLAWPLIVVGVAALAGRGRRAVAVLIASVAGSLASLILRLTIWDDADPVGSAARAVNGTDAVADQLLIGCALAAALHLVAGRRRTSIDQTDEGRLAQAPGRAALRILGPAALGFLVWVAIARPGGATVANNRLYLTWGATAFAIASAVVVLVSVLDDRSPLGRVLAARPLVAVGRVSYGVYLWHFPVILAVQAEMERSSVPVQRLVALALTALATLVSWRFVERPVLARRNRLHPETPVDGAPGRRRSTQVPTPTR